MTSRDFAYWLQGYFEITRATTAAMSAEQVEIVKRHLSLVFIHEIDPSFGGKEKQDELNEAHGHGIVDEPPIPTSNDGQGIVYRC